MVDSEKQQPPLDKDLSHILGWCATGGHQGIELKFQRPCPGTIKNSRGGTTTCICWCHGKTSKPKQRRGRRRKK